MRNIEHSFMRLMVLCNHLQDFDKGHYTPMMYIFSDDQKHVILGNGNGKFYVIYPFVVYEMSKLFTEFYEDKRNYVRRADVPKMDINYSMMEFFGISTDVFLHLFSVGTQCIEKFGGSDLTPSSTPEDVAHNIECYLQYVIECEPNNLEAENNV